VLKILPPRLNETIGQTAGGFLLPKLIGGSPIEGFRCAQNPPAPTKPSVIRRWFLLL
jgi:hypothetical protein